MICAYSKLYLEHARTELAVSMDYAINSLGFDPNEWYAIFCGSFTARQFEAGNPKYVTGMSGIELTHLILTQAGLETERKEYYSIERTPEYWLGWALAYYQWEKNLHFSEILSFTSMEKLLQMYRKYHEMDIRQFCDRLDVLRNTNAEEANLKKMRMLVGYSQRMLALKSNVPLRTIQQYEQKQKDINHAQAETVLVLAQALGCSSRDIMEAVF